MRLLVISHTSHYRKEGAVVGWGPTVREIARLAELFDEVVHIAPLHRQAAPPSALPYEAPNVRLVAVPPAGGSTVSAKLHVLRVLPAYLSAILGELGNCDVVHVRCPSNIGLLAILVLAVSRRPALRWIKYAGNWRPRAPESLSYRVQRWLLDHGVPRALVTVNGRWPDQRSHVRSFLNPCLTDEELGEGAAVGARKNLRSPLRLLFVGRLEEEKGCGRALEVLAGLEARGVRARLDVAGDGPDRKRFEAQAAAAGLTERVHFLGWLARPALASLYSDAHFLLLPSTSSEGWPKVLSEAMAYGVVPMTSDISSMPQLIESFRTGRVLDAKDRDGFVEAVAEYVSEPERWKMESCNAMEAGRLFAYDRYLAAVRNLLDLEAA